MVTNTNGGGFVLKKCIADDSVISSGGNISANVVIVQVIFLFVLSLTLKTFSAHSFP